MFHNAHFSKLLAFPFRLFFLLTAVYAIMSVLAWLIQLLAGWQLSVGWSALHWHSHEMLFGMVAAAITGFILSAVCNWTGAPPLQGRGLLLLGLLWLVGRLVMWTASWLPTILVAAVDLLFLPVVAIYLFRVLRRYGNTRNLILVVILTLLSLSNLMMHIGFLTKNVLYLQYGELAALNIITLMMVVIAGRIIPAFTANWLRFHQNKCEAVKTSVMLDRLVFVSTALMIPVDLFSGSPVLVAGTAFVAAILNGLRFLRWAGWRVLNEPLLWILHLGYLWIVLALLLKGLGVLNIVPVTAWQHALGVGAMATLILGVMTRVALGHTGRQLKLPAYGFGIYISISIAAFARVFTALGFLDYRLGLLLAAVAWTIGFALFIIIYWPILSSPRVDGKPG